LGRRVIDAISFGLLGGLRGGGSSGAAGGGGVASGGGAGVGGGGGGRRRAGWRLRQRCLGLAGLVAALRFKLVAWQAGQAAALHRVAGQAAVAAGLAVAVAAGGLGVQAAYLCWRGRPRHCSRWRGRWGRLRHCSRWRGRRARLRRCSDWRGRRGRLRRCSEWRAGGSGGIALVGVAGCGIAADGGAGGAGCGIAAGGGPGCGWRRAGQARRSGRWWGRGRGRRRAVASLLGWRGPVVGFRWSSA